MGGEPRYEVFISYSTDPDEPVARALEHELKRFLSPWYRPGPRFRVFRDATDLTPGDGLTGKIAEGLEHSKHLVVLLSPRSALPGGWVDVEVAAWRGFRDAERTEGQPAQRRHGTAVEPLPVGRTITPVVTEWPAHTRGTEPEDAANLAEFDWRSADVPPSMRDVFEEAPLAVDLRWAHAASAAGSLTLAHPRFRDVIMSIAAGVLGIPRSEFDAVVRSMRRRSRLLIGTIVAAVLILSLAIFANIRLRQSAERQRDAAIEDQLAAEEATEAARVELAGVNADLDQRQRELDDAVGALDETRDALDAATDDLDLANENLRTTTENLDAAQDDLDDAEDALAAAQGDLATARDDLDTAEQDLADARDDVARATAEREAAVAAQRAAQAEVDRLDGELETLLDQVDQAQADLDAATAALVVAEAEAERQLGIADARRLSGLAQSAIATDLSRGSLLAIESAYRTGLPDASGGASPNSLTAPPAVVQTEVTYESRDVLLRALFERPRLHTTLHSDGDRIGAVAVSADGSVLAGAGDGFVQLWDPVTFRPVRRIAASSSVFSDVAVDPTGEVLAVGSGNATGTVQLLDVASGAELGSRQLGFFASPAALRFSAGGRFLAAGASPELAGDTTPVRVWDRSTDQPTDLPGTSNGSALAFTDDDQWLAAVDDAGLSVWRLTANGWQRAALPVELDAGSVVSISIAPGSNRLAAGNRSGEILLLDLETDELATVTSGFDPDMTVTALAFAADGTLYATDGAQDETEVTRYRIGRPAPDADPEAAWGVELSRWRIGETGSLDPIGDLLLTSGAEQQVWDAERDLPIALGLQRRVATVEPGGRRVAFERDDGGVDLADVSSLRTLTTLRPPAPGRDILSVAIDSRGEVAVGTHARLGEFGDLGPAETAVWNTRTGALLGSLPTGPELDRVALSADGASAAVFDGRRVSVWRTATGQRVADIDTGVDGSIVDVALLPDQRLVVAQDSILTLWRPTPTAPLATWVPDQRVQGLAVDPTDGSVVVSITDRAVRLSAATLEPVDEWIAPNETLLNGVTVSPDGATIAAGADRLDGSSAGVLAVWDAESGQPLTTPLVGHDSGQFGGGPTRVWFAASNTLVSRGPGPPTRIWEFGVDAWIEIACRRTNRNLTRSEWADAFPGSTYRATCPSLGDG